MGAERVGKALVIRPEISEKSIDGSDIVAAPRSYTLTECEKWGLGLIRLGV